MCRLKYGQRKKVAQMTVHRVCESCGFDVSSNFASGTSDGVVSEMQTTVVKHAQNEDLLLSELKLSEQADLSTGHSR